MAVDDHGLEVLKKSGEEVTPGDKSDYKIKVHLKSSEVSIGGGTQYAEGDTDASITGTAIMWEDAGDTLRPVSQATPLPIEIVAGSSSGTEYTEGDTDASITGTAVLAEGPSNTLTPLQLDASSNLKVSQQGTVTVTGTVALDAGSLAALEDINVTVTVAPEIEIKNDSGNPVPVSAASLPLPTGASTSAKQDTIIGHVDGIEALLTTIDADTSTLAGAVSGTEMQVDVLSSALPTGASTAANQTTIIGHLDGVEGLLTTIDSDTSALAGTVSGSEVQVDVVSSAPSNEAKSGTATLSSVAGSASSQTLLAANAARLNASFYNDSTAILYLKFGTTASSTSFTVKIQPEGYYELTRPNIYTGRIDGIWASAAGAARVTEMTA